MITTRILLVVFLFLLTENTLIAQTTIEQTMDEDSITSAWHYHSIFIVSRDSIHQILIQKISRKQISKIRTDKVFIDVNIDEIGNGVVKLASPVKYIGKKCSKMLVENLQSTKIWVPAFNIDKDDGRKFYTSSLLPLIVEKEDLLKAAEKRDK